MNWSLYFFFYYLVSQSASKYWNVYYLSLFLILEYWKILKVCMINRSDFTWEWLWFTVYFLCSSTGEKGFLMNDSGYFSIRYDEIVFGSRMVQVTFRIFSYDYLLSLQYLFIKNRALAFNILLILAHSFIVKITSKGTYLYLFLSQFIYTFQKSLDSSIWL